jgi:hypothetical protein
MKNKPLDLEYINNVLIELTKNGINYDTRFCDSKHAYVIHCWIDEEYKCNFFARSLKWVPFGFHKGISGQGIEDLKVFLLNTPQVFKKREYSYKEKFEALKDTLLQVRDENNFDIIDPILEEYC